MKKLLVVLLVLVSVLFLSACSQKYTVDYDGMQSFFEGAKSSYKAGEKVRFGFYPVTDCSQHVYIDGESYNYDYDDELGMFVVEFTMPEHEVKVEYSMENDSIMELNMYLDYYSAVYTADGTEYTEYVLYPYTEDEVEITEFRKEANESEKIIAKYIVPCSILDELNAVIEEYSMDNWDTLGAEVPEDGAYKAVNFLYDGIWFTTNTDNIPEEGREAYAKISDILVSYMIDEYYLNED